MPIPQHSLLHIYQTLLPSHDPRIPHYIAVVFYQLPVMSSFPSHTKDFFSSPTLSLSLAGVFRRATAVTEAEEGDEGSCGGSRKEQLSSENTGPPRSHEEVNLEAVDDEDNVDDDGTKKKRKKYHRHTAEQIREMEALFKESPHPDEKQRQQLSKRLGLSSKRVKFWFQNRRTQIKAVQERHENSVLKSEVDRLRDENRCLRESAKKAFCPNCGFVTTNPEAAALAEEKKLRIENARLKTEIEKWKASTGNASRGRPSSTSNSNGCNNQERSSSASVSVSCLEQYHNTDGVMFGKEKEKIMKVVVGAMEELNKMATMGEPLWVRSVETGREILNYDEYLSHKSGNGNGHSAGHVKKLSIEASRDTALLFVDLPVLVQTFMNVEHWKEIFFSIVSKAATLDILCHGDLNTCNGRVQLMVGEMQMRTAMVPSREVYFVRHCEQLSPHCWAIVDVSIDSLGIDASRGKCWKHPSGIVIWDQSNGRCKVTWVEHLECEKVTVPTLYRSLVNNGQAFGARHWMATMQLQLERIVFTMATNVPTKDCYGVSTMAGRKSTLKLAQRMTCSFCSVVGASTCYKSWTRFTTREGDEIRVASRKNNGNPGDPVGLILCAVSSFWLPIPPTFLFDFLRDESRRHEWDVISTLGSMKLHSMASLVKAQDRGNAATIHATHSGETNVWVIQDSSTNVYESMVVYSPVEATAMQSVMAGGESSSVAILPSGYSILPDGMSARPPVITSRTEEAATSEGSILTVAFQLMANASPEARLTMESVETVTSVVSCALHNIRTCLECQDS